MRHGAQRCFTRRPYRTVPCPRETVSSSEQRERDLDVAAHRIGVRAALLGLGDKSLRLLAIRQRRQRDQQLHSKAKSSGFDPSDADTRSDHGILDIDALASGDAEHGVLPAGGKSEREKLLGIGPTSAVAAELSWGREIHFHDAV